MKNKTLKKMMALGLAGVMMLGMSTTAFAANGVNTNTADTKTMNIPITQTLYFKNAEASDVYEPNLYYAYTITPGQAGATVKDHAGVSASVKAGDMRAFGLQTTTGTKDFGINFSSDHKTVKADAEGKSAVTKKVTVLCDGSKILSDDNVIIPGVYRYIITQTTTAAQKNAVGVVEVGAQDKTLVLDITIDNEGNIVGSVIQKPVTPDNDNPNVDNSEDADGDGVEDDKTDVTDDENGKVTGFGDPDEPDDPSNPFGNEDPKDTTPDDPTKPAGDQQDPTDQQTKATTATELPAFYDMYTTYNVTVTKAVTGGMGDKANYFPFQTDISNSIHGAAFTYSVTDNGSKAVEATKKQLEANGVKTLGSASATVADGLQLKDAGKINLIGVPSSTSANVSVLANEFNNTGDTYKVTATDFGIAAETNLATQTASTGATAASFKDDTANTTFTVTNNLEAISPTGVALRFAPYLIMLAGACFLLLVSRRRRVED